MQREDSSEVVFALMYTTSNADCLILGAGYTGRRVARRLLALGQRVRVTTREPAELKDLAALGAQVVNYRAFVEPTPDCEGALVLHSIPVIETPAGLGDVTSQLFRHGHPRRVVYLSTTGVYGSAVDVDETTPVAPRDERHRLRVEAERTVLGRPWQGLVLRPAAIYGPGRGVHVSMGRDTYRITENGDNYVSRIHVEDLSSIVTAALLSDLTGAYPVADHEPCTSREIAAFCADLLNLPMPPGDEPRNVPRTLRANRRVDGSAILRLLGIELVYPSYRNGIPASIT